MTSLSSILLCEDNPEIVYACKNAMVNLRFADLWMEGRRWVQVIQLISSVTSLVAKCLRLLLDPKLNLDFKASEKKYMKKHEINHF